MIVTRTRRSAALILLLLMAVNFTAEGVSIYRAHIARHLVSAPAAICKPAADGDKAAKTSCCSAPKTKATCGCPHCGDHCPMGDACTCGHDGKPTRRSEGLFFRMPGCHPEHATHDSSYLPLSMRLVFLVDNLVPAIVKAAVIDEDPTPFSHYVGFMPPPPVPPPRSARA